MTCSPRFNNSPRRSPPISSSSSSSSSRRSPSRSIRAALEIADAASWYCSIVIVALVLLSILPFDHDTNNGDNYYDDTTSSSSISSSSTTTRWRGSRFLDNNRPCDEIYVVSEGETLHTISDKCGDPFIVERNPHIHDPDDVFPGLVIKITPLVVKN